MGTYIVIRINTVARWVIWATNLIAYQVPPKPPSRRSQCSNNDTWSCKSLDMQLVIAQWVWGFQSNALDVEVTSLNPK